MSRDQIIRERQAIQLAKAESIQKIKDLIYNLEALEAEELVLIKKWNELDNPKFNVNDN